MKAAVFLDRDGVLVADKGPICRAEEFQILNGVPTALRALKSRGFALVVVSNQAAVARGLATEEQVWQMHASLDEQLTRSGGPCLDAWYFCPHHHQASIAAYRVVCDCRKPRPGLLLKAARDLALDLRSSFMVGDRLTDITAGKLAGTRAILVQTGMHLEPAIETPGPSVPIFEPDYTCAGLREATEWILGGQ